MNMNKQKNVMCVCVCVKTAIIAQLKKINNVMK